ncbi:hypothetical protein BGZ70_003330 [Mortierella alpina]|uniref:Uncharacterized protein n=1 Tax=Mortierella alpina TaxID=64518 RepID=A0A9P6ISN3_MORAP|nr:hypothetical protein BGZ70_003330 [Mortierella alpina]
MVLLSVPLIFVRSHCGTRLGSLRNTLLISTRPTALALLVWTATSTTLTTVAEGAPLTLAPRGVQNANAASGDDAPLDSVAHKKSPKSSVSPTVANPHVNSDASSSASGPVHRTTPAPSSKQLHQNQAADGSSIEGHEAKSVAQVGPTAQGGMDDGQGSSPSASASPSIASPSAQDHGGHSQGPLVWVLTSVAAVVAIGVVVVGTVVARRNRSKKEPARKGSFFVGFEDVHRQRLGKGKPWQVHSQSTTAPGSPSVEREQFWNPLP